MDPARRQHPPESSFARLVEGPIDVRAVALTGLFTLAIVYTLYFARSFLLPVVLAILLSFLLAPLMRAFKRIHVPQAIAAALVMFTFVGATLYGMYALSGPASSWIASAPESLRKIDDKVRAFRKPVQRMNQAAEQVQQMANVGDGTSDTTVQKVEIKDAGITDSVFSVTQGFLAGGMVVVILLYFLLASGDLFLRKLVRLLPRLEDKKVAVEIARQIEGQISTYLVTITGINVGLGVLVGFLLSLIGMPNPVLWGVMIATFNFVPYVGPFTSMVVLTLVGVTTFDSFGRALLAPGLFLCVDTIQSNLIAPALLGRRLSLNPVVIFLAVTFWGWLWGIGGALLAVPMLATLKIFCDEIEPLAAIGEFLGPGRA
jgi:predicted PurR-regulated permease PerM